LDADDSQQESPEMDLSGSLAVVRIDGAKGGEMPEEKCAENSLKDECCDAQRV
jgi:hypothetical protein